MVEALETKERESGLPPHDHILLILKALDRAGQQEISFNILSSLCSLFQVGNYHFQAFGRPGVGTVMYPSREGGYDKPWPSGLSGDLSLLETQGFITLEEWRVEVSPSERKFALTDKGREHAQQLASQYPQETASIETTIQELTQKEEGFEQAVLGTAYSTDLQRLMAETEAYLRDGTIPERLKR